MNSHKNKLAVRDNSLKLNMWAMDTAAMADLTEAMVDMADPMEDMVAMVMERGRLRLSLVMDTGAMADLMEAMADTMEVMEAMAMASKGLQTQSISFKFIMIFMLQ